VPRFLGACSSALGGHAFLLAMDLLVGKDIVFRFIIEYSSLRDFGP